MHEQDLIGSVFDERYEVIAVIGQGGMGTVYKAKEIGLDREIALKIMHANHLNEVDNRSRFEREGKILSAVKHRHIVTIYRLGLFQDQIPYIAMEYLAGKTLKQVIDDEGKLPWERSLSFAIQLCDALEHVHANGIVHRDIKPGNIMIINEAEGDFVKIVDFGLMKLLSDTWQMSQKLTQTGLLIGTAQYFSPEQSLGQAVDRRSDIYSLACVIYECLSGQPPFDADNPIGLLHKHVNEMPQALSTVLAGQNLPEGLDFVLMKALQKDQELRYQSMKDLKEDLLLVQAGQGKQIESSEELRPWIKEIAKSSNRKVIAGSVLLIAIFIAAAYFLISKPGKNTSESTIASKVASFDLDASRLKEAESFIQEAENQAQKHNLARTNSSITKTLEKLASIQATTATAADSAKELGIITRIRDLLIKYPTKDFMLTTSSINRLADKYGHANRLKESALIRAIEVQNAHNQGNGHQECSAHGLLSYSLICLSDYNGLADELKKYEQALQKYHLQSSPHEIWFLTYKGLHLLRTDKTQKEQAIKYLHQAFSLLQKVEPGDTDKAWAIGLYAYQAGDFHLAEKATLLCHNQALANHELTGGYSLPESFYLLARIYFGLGEYSKAKECAEQAVRLSKYSNFAFATPLAAKENLLKLIEQIVIRQAKNKPGGKTE